MQRAATAQHYFTTECDDLGFHHQLSLGTYHFAQAQRDLEWHHHAGRIEICYLASGMQTYEVGGCRYVLKGHDLFLTYPDETHGSGGLPQEKGVLYWLQVGVPAGTAPFLGCDVTAVRPLFTRLFALPRRVFRGTRRVQTLFDEVITAYLHGDPPLRRVTVATGVLRLLLEVLHAGECVTDTPASPDINLVIAYIDQHLATPLPVTALAELMHLSLSQFKARFKHEVGIPPAEYVLRRKIEHAKALLVQPDCRITDLAYTLGFSSSQYFATVFKRFTLVSPTAYQRLAGEAP